MNTNEPSHDKTNDMAYAPSEDSDQSGHPPVWSESSLSAWRKLGSLATHWAHSEDSDQTGRMPWLLGLRWTQMPFCWFCHVAAQIQCVFLYFYASSIDPEKNFAVMKGNVIKEPPHDKTNKVVVRPEKTQMSLGIRPVWSESSLELNG